MARIRTARRTVEEVQARVDNPAEVRAAVRNDIRYHCRYYFDWNLEEFHEEMLSSMFDGGHLICNVPTDHAKAVADDVVVPVTTGWKCHGDLRPGDWVFGPDGRPTPVVAVNEPTTAGVEVHFSDGSSTACHERHEWTVWSRSEKRERTYEAGRLAKLKLLSSSSNGGGRIYDRPHYQLTRTGALWMPEADLLIDPYTLGVWLGDGCSTGASFCGSAGDVEHICSRIPYESTWRTVHRTTGVHYRGFSGLLSKLRKLDLYNNKHIPMLYLRASERQRRELLAGLIDTDGHMGHLGKARFSGVNERLVRGVAELARSLGYRATVHRMPGNSIDRHIGTQLIHGRKDVWGCQWVPDDGLPQGTLSRKAGTRIAPRRRVGIVGVEPASPRSARCIQVARPDGLYLVGENMHPTHNSTMGAFLFPLLSLMENPDETHIICGANINDSKRRVQTLQREIETNHLLIQDFPWIAKPEEKEGRIWAATQFNVVGRTINKPNPSVLAAAVGSNDVKGRRGKLMMDDIEGEDARWSPLKRQQLYSWLTLEAWRCFEDKHESERPLMCLLGTPFDVDSIYFRMEAQEWKVIRHGAYTAGIPGTYSARYLWPAKAQKVESARKRLRKLEFSVAYLMDPTGGDPSKVSAAELTKATQEAKFEYDQSEGFVCLDPAAGGQGNTRADYAGVAVVRVHWKVGEAMPNIEVLEAHSMTQGLFEQVHLCAALSAQYGYPVLYETNAQQGQVYRDTFAHLHPETALQRHYTTHQNKFDDHMGMSVVKTLMIDRRISVPASRVDDEGIATLINELRDLAPPFNQHNHISAAIWFAVRHVYEKVRVYGLAPAENGFYQGNYDWFHKQSPYYGGRQPAVHAYRQFGYRPWTWQEDIVARERQKEVERFQAQLRGRRP